MTVTIDGKVLTMEESHRETLWVAFCLKDSPWKIILKGQNAEASLREVMCGDHIVASGSYVKYVDGTFKLFADYCMKFTPPVRS